MFFHHLDPAVLMLIASYLKQSESHLSPYATISRPWLSVVETLTFRKLHVDSEDRLQEVVHYLTPDRWVAFRALDVTIQLPEYERHLWYKLETEAVQQTNHLVFSESLRNTFETINSWYEDASVRSWNSAITLAIQAISISDFWHLDSRNQKRRRYRVPLGAENARHNKSYLSLCGDLPLVPNVLQLEIRGAPAIRILSAKRDQVCCPRLLSGETASRIIKACPRVTRVHLELFDKEPTNYILREEKRQALAASWFDLPSGLRHLTLDYPGLVPSDHALSPEGISVTDGKDALSLGLGNMSQQLETLEVNASLSDDFFHTTDDSTWPHLRRLHVNLDACAPDGNWMLELDPQDSEVEIDSDEDEDERVSGSNMGHRHHERTPDMHCIVRSFRTSVNRDTLDGMHLAIARAMTRMPKLHGLQLSIGDHDSGLLCKFESDGNYNHKVVWISKSETMYEPHPDVIQAWKAVFENRSGELDMQVLGREHYPVPLAPRYCDREYEARSYCYNGVYDITT